MAVPSRQEALATLEEGRRATDELLERLDEQELVRTRTIGGGDWSALDLIGHLGTWEELALDALREWREAKMPLVEELFRSNDAVDTLNADRVAALRASAPDQIVSWARDTHRAMVSEIEGMSDDEWNSPAPYETERRANLGTLLGSVMGAPQRPFGHAFAHLPDLEAYVDSVRAE